MSRLFEITYDKDKWVLKGTRDNGYTLVNKETYDSYDIGGDVIGIEQQDDGSFMVFKRVLLDEWQIYRFIAAEGKTTTTFIESFHDFNFLTDDTILFDNRNVYSISKNAYVSDFDWISHKYHIDIYDLPDGKKSLFLSEKIITTAVPDIYVMVIVDCEQFKPISQAYSSLRDKLFTLTDDFTFKDLIEEDKKYANIIADITRSENKDANDKGMKILLSQVAAVH